MMKKLKLVKTAGRKAAQRLVQCPVVVLTLATGEVVKRGCGRSGMAEFGACLRCLYCGNYLYKKATSLESLWFHFRWAREFWRTHHKSGRDFVNGVPVTGKGESLPAACLNDLSEAKPPSWFSYFMNKSEREFRDYLINLKAS